MNSGDQPVLQFDKVSLSFDGTPALRDVSFTISSGETLILLGAAGSGKTTLLKLALGLLRPDAGHLFLFGDDVTNAAESQWFDLRSKIGVLFQEGGLFDSLTIEENVAYPLLNQHLVDCPPDQVQPRVEQSLEFVELGHTLAKFPSELSGGMRRRVGIARAIVTEPQLLLYDSPTAGLDPITATNIISLIVKGRDLRNTTTVMATHRYQDGEMLASYFFDKQGDVLRRAGSNGHQVRGPERTRYLVLNEGAVVFDGNSQQLTESTDTYVSKFVRR